MALKLSTLTLRREGDFVQAVDGAHHCGPKALLVDIELPGKVKTKAKGIAVRYTLTVACGPTLDHRGFLFDQAMVDLWFKRQGERVTSLSCEAYAINLANRFLEKLAKDAPHCDVRGITLQLSPAPHQASISAHFVKGE